jgi:micrococcal nuclease
VAKIVKFRKGRKPKLPQEWTGYRAKRRANSGIGYAITGLVLGSIIGVAIITAPALSIPPAVNVLGLWTNAEPIRARTFSICHTGGGTNCVVDGDTIWMDGVKIRVADIDAPETHPPRCDQEAELGNRATQRLLELVNRGPLTAERSGVRDEDRYGRKLRILTRDGQSLGGILVQEGLARTWDGSRHPWC